MKKSTITREMASLLALTAPILAGLSSSELMALTDTLLVSGLGTSALASVGIVSSIGLFFHATIYGAITPVSVKLSYLFGKHKDATKTKRLLPVALCYGMILGVLSFTAMQMAPPVLLYFSFPIPEHPALFDYWWWMAFFLGPYSVLLVYKAFFEAIDRPWTGCLIVMSAAAINGPLSFALIFGKAGFPEMGLSGAGIASVISEFLACATAWATANRVAGNDTSTTESDQCETSTTGFSREGIVAAFGYAGETSAVVFAGAMMSWFGSQALAANQITHSVASLLYMLPLGIAAATAIRVSQSRGSQDTEKLQHIGFASLLTTSIWTSCTAFGYVYFGGLLATWFSSDTIVVRYAIDIFIALAFLQILDGIQSTALGALRGMQDYKTPTTITLVSYWIMAVPLSAFFAFLLELGPKGIWIGFSMGLLMSAILLPIRFFKTLQKLKSS